MTDFRGNFDSVPGPTRFDSLTYRDSLRLQEMEAGWHLSNALAVSPFSLHIF